VCFKRATTRSRELAFAVESQRDSIIQPRVARDELPWVTPLTDTTLKGLQQPRISFSRPSTATLSDLLAKLSFPVNLTHDATRNTPHGSRFTLHALTLLLSFSAFSATPSALTKPSTNHWAFQPLVNPAPPKVHDTQWPRAPLDYFILAKLEEKGLEPTPPSDKATLLRRATFDLLGLPPTPSELNAFLADNSPTAFATVVDRLLASPHYGEHWGRHWLDVARFAESQGFEYDKIREHAWRYRDYIVQSFNDDKPYFQFVKEQLAGDALAPVTHDGIIATGFLVAGPYDEAGNTSASALLKARIREEELEDMIAAVGQTFLGMTVNCARCHDHKFDPIPQRDYYRLKAALDGVRHGERSLLVPEDAKPKSDVPKTYAAISRQPEATFVLVRGDVEKKTDPVTAGGLSALSNLPADFGLPAEAPEAQRRLKLAQWITAPGNPLTSRVIVNRVWHYHFGHGLVGTPNDLGANGERPSHPELLDYLATEFLNSGGSVKSLHRLIMLSSTYQESSESLSDLARHAAASSPRWATPQKKSSGAAANTIDADDRLLWHFPLRRLEAEEVRDSMLSVSGEINLETGGPSYRPFTVFVSNSHFYNLTDPIGPEYNRRSLYRMIVHSGRDPLLDSLDCPDPSTKTPVRNTTTTPIQALGLMNDSFIQRQSKHFSERLQKEAGPNPKGQVDLAWRLTFSRSPSKEELTRSLKLTREHGLESLCWVLLNSSELLYVR